MMPSTAPDPAAPRRDTDSGLLPAFPATGRPFPTPTRRNGLDAVAQESERLTSPPGPGWVEATCPLCGPGRHEVFLEDIPDRLGQSTDRFRYVHCPRCTLIRLHPIPDAQTIASFYPETFWRTDDKRTPASRLQRLEAWYRKRLLRAEFLMLAPLLGPGVRHLDVGCATGDLMLLARERGAETAGIEFSEAAVRYCAEVRGLDVVQGDLPAHDFGARRFDVITYNAVLEHVADPVAHLRAARRLLTPQGRLCILGLPNIRSLGFRLAGPRWLGLDCPRHLYQFSPDSLERLLSTSGFRLLTWSTRSPRFNRSTLVASAFPGLHRHAFDRIQRETGRNPVLRKLTLLALLQLATPLDWLASAAGVGELLSCTAAPEEAGRQAESEPGAETGVPGDRP